MPLDTGYYTIKSKSANRFVGRAPVEDSSLDPKAIWVLPHGTQAPNWVVEKRSNGTFRLKAMGSATGYWHNAVYASITDKADYPPEDWLLTVQASEGNNIYTIERNDYSGNGWAVGATESQSGLQINIKGLIMNGYPPKYRAEHLFEFVRIG